MDTDIPFRDYAAALDAYAAACQHQQYPYTFGRYLRSQRADRRARAQPTSTRTGSSPNTANRATNGTHANRGTRGNRGTSIPLPTQRELRDFNQVRGGTTINDASIIELAASKLKQCNMDRSLKPTISNALEFMQQIKSTMPQLYEQFQQAKKGSNTSRSRGPLRTSVIQPQPRYTAGRDRAALNAGTREERQRLAYEQERIQIELKEKEDEYARRKQEYDRRMEELTREKEQLHRSMQRTRDDYEAKRDRLPTNRRNPTPSHRPQTGRTNSGIRIPTKSSKKRSTKRRRRSRSPVAAHNAPPPNKRRNVDAHNEQVNQVR